jgi:uncharacterized repeat protein (TIGR03847 family)
MDSAKYNFGEVDKIRTEAIGVAGKRIFRILIDCPSKAAATLWLEKEQVYGLSMAMKKMAEAKGQEGRSGEEADFPDIAEADSTPVSSGGSLEFKVSRLGLAYGPSKSRVTVFFYDERDEVVSEGESSEEEYEEEAVGPAALQVSLANAQLDEFITQSLDECSSGRGTDALSRHAMVATGKVDPNTNGHFRH